MKALFLFFAISIGMAAQAQKITWYSAEGKDFYQVTECAPGSEAAFYSSTGGGVYLGSQPIAENGTVTVKGSKAFHPKMVLNVGTGGSKQVAYAGDREFAIASPEIHVSGNTATISWSGAAAANSDISFQVLSSTDGNHYSIVYTIVAEISDELISYNCSIPWNGGTTLYKVIVANGSGSRYTTQPMLLAATSAISVFPTTTTDMVVIYLPSVADVAGYSLVSGEGKTVAEGKLKDLHSSISLRALPAGIYFVTVKCGFEKKVARIWKQ